MQVMSKVNAILVVVCDSSPFFFVLEVTTDTPVQCPHAIQTRKRVSFEFVFQTAWIS